MSVSVTSNTLYDVTDKNNTVSNKVLNVYYYIMILFKQLYWLSCCHLTFRKLLYCLSKTRIDLVSLSFSFNVIKQLQSFVSVNTSFYVP